MTTQTQIRDSFWDAFPEFAKERKTRCTIVKGKYGESRLLRVRKTQNEYRADIRMSFVDYVDSLQRNGQISESLASRVTL